MTWWYAVVESKHELQNPTSPEKIRRLARWLELRAESRVLDVGSGRGGPAILLAREFGCRVTCLERSPEFSEAARARALEARVDHLIDVVETDAANYEVDPGAFDAALCLGASFIYGGLAPTIRTLKRAVPERSLIAVGEPYWREWPLPEGLDLEDGNDWVPLEDTVAKVESAGVECISLIASSKDDWDRYESLHWLALEEWLAESPDDPDAPEFRARGRHYRDRYLRWRRALLGWAIFVCRT